MVKRFTILGWCLVTVFGWTAPIQVLAAENDGALSADASPAQPTQAAPKTSKKQKHHHKKKSNPDTTAQTPSAINDGSDFRGEGNGSGFSNMGAGDHVAGTTGTSGQ